MNGTSIWARRRATAGLLSLVLAAAVSTATGGEVRFDFETGDLQGW